MEDLIGFNCKNVGYIRMKFINNAYVPAITVCDRHIYDAQDITKWNPTPNKLPTPLNLVATQIYYDGNYKAELTWNQNYNLSDDQRYVLEISDGLSPFSYLTSFPAKNDNPWRWLYGVNLQADKIYTFRIKVQGEGYLDSDYCYCELIFVNPMQLPEPTNFVITQRYTNNGYDEYLTDFTWDHVNIPNAARYTLEGTILPSTEYSIIGSVFIYDDNDDGPYFTLSWRDIPITDDIYRYRVKASCEGYNDSDYCYYDQFILIPLERLPSPDNAMVYILEEPVEGGETTYTVNFNWDQNESIPDTAEYILEAAELPSDVEDYSSLTYSSYGTISAAYVKSVVGPYIVNSAVPGIIYFYRVKIVLEGYADSVWTGADVSVNIIE